MDERLKIQLQDFRKQYNNYYNYLKDSDWTDDDEIVELYKTEADILTNIVRDIKRFVDENKDHLHLKPVQNFFGLVNKILNLHVSRIDKYIKDNNWTAVYKDSREQIMGRLYELKKEEDDLNEDVIKELEETLSTIEFNKRNEIKFQNSLFTQKTKIRLEALNLNINTEATARSPHLFHSNRKASLIMRELLYNKQSYLKEKTDQLNINWGSPNPSTSKELYINMNPKDIPPYDNTRHFFEQDKSTIEFWAEEINKIKNGVNIGGYNMSGFVYTGINFCAIPQGAGVKKVEAPALLTDNIYYIDESLKEAILKDKEGIMFYGSRRASKALRNSEVLKYSDGSERPIGDAKIGDIIYGGDGKLTKIEGVFPQGVVKLYRITFEDGREIDCCGEHLWEVFENGEKTSKAINTNSIIQGTFSGSTYEIPLTKPIEYACEEEHYIGEYIDYIEEILKKGVDQPIAKISIEQLVKIQTASLEKRKHFINIVSKFYLGEYTSEYVTLSILDETLSDTVLNVLYGLGLSVYKESNNILKIQKNRGKIKIVNIQYVGEDNATCITVDNEDKLFLTTNSIVTHNSVVESIYLAHGLLSVPGCSAVLTGFSDQDLGHVNSYLNTTFTNMPHAIQPNIIINSDDEFIIGMKGQSVQDAHIMGSLSIVNLEGGQKKTSTQKLAGFTPDRIVVDECSKGKILKPWLALRPALSGGEGGKRRTVAFLAATAGEASLSVDAEKMLRDPDSFGILPMNYDLLESFVDPEYVTWNRNTFTTFMPAQMSLEGVKNKSNLAEFLNIDNEDLKKVEIQVTDWKAGKERFEKRREATDNYDARISEMSSFPLDTEDVYLSGDKNKFNVLGLKRHKAHIIEKELLGRSVHMYQNSDGQIEITLTNSPVIETHPYEGGEHDAPVVMYEEPIENPPFGLYILGFDDVKHDTSDGTSLISATIFKRGFQMDEWSDRIVCTLATRPSKKEEAYKTVYCMMKRYNAIVFPEAEDEGFKDFLERRHRVDAIKHLAEGVDLSRSLDLDVSRHRQIGYPATTKNVKRLNDRVLAYTEEDVESGNVTLDGYTRIPDPMLLEEMIQDKKGKNADRIRSFGLALVYAEYLDKNNMYIPRTTSYNRLGSEKPKGRVMMNRGHGTSQFKGIKRGF